MGENFNYDFRTPQQKKLEEKRKSIVTMFTNYRAKATADTSDYRIMQVIASQIGCTTPNVRTILIKAQVIKPKRKAAAMRK